MSVIATALLDRESERRLDSCAVSVGSVGALRRGRRGGWIGVLVGRAGMLAFGWGLFVVARRLISHLGGT